MIDYNKRLVEVDEVLKYLSEEDYKKIPKSVIEAIKQNKDKTYSWKYDTAKKLKNQNLCDDTIAILSYINMEFLLNDEQKEFIKKLHSINNT
jgi:hypothetical protein